MATETKRMSEQDENFEENGDASRLKRFAAELSSATEMQEESLRALAEVMGLDMIDLTTAKVDLSLLRTFPIRLIHKYNVFPVCIENGALVLATSEPSDVQALDAVGAATGMSIIPVVAIPNELSKLIKTNLGVGSETVDGLVAQQEERTPGVEMLEDFEVDDSEAAEAAQEASVVRLVNELLVEAIETRASDIHLEAQAKGLKVRYRIDGVLQDQPLPPEINRFQAAIVSRLKIMSRLNIAEKRIPQDGRIKLRVKGREVDIRVSIIPMLHGEGVVMRILDKDRMNFSLLGIGMDEDIYAEFQKLIGLPHGIILVTGPTGSGKTTTLYSALNEIKSEATKIITTEDPIEYQLDGINQIQVQAKVGLTFAASLRAILRHDPDIVLVGEIRDLETAENAVQASLTGHLVFSTLHTNDAAGAFMRLVDMGVEPFLVSSTVEGIMAQRLVRKICPECKHEITPNWNELPNDFPFDDLMDAGGQLWKGEGCRRCRGTGYSGRVGIYELLRANDEIRKLTSEHCASQIVKAAARRAGMRTLREHAWLKAIRGESTIEEAIRVTKADELLSDNDGNTIHLPNRRPGNMM
ncbi:MAG: ATPase, T2SS/T4P/T4SS family [Thermoguttaceae bacterium]|nr:ATPase, T2SS/T4P/T4SS family [Thermoguttaceae bacterium]